MAAPSSLPRAVDLVDAARRSTINFFDCVHRTFHVEAVLLPNKFVFAYNSNLSSFNSFLGAVRQAWGGVLSTILERGCKCFSKSVLRNSGTAATRTSLMRRLHSHDVLAKTRWRPFRRQWSMGRPTSLSDCRLGHPTSTDGAAANSATPELYRGR